MKCKKCNIGKEMDILKEHIKEVKYNETAITNIFLLEICADLKEIKKRVEERW